MIRRESRRAIGRLEAAGITGRRHGTRGRSGTGAGFPELGRLSKRRAIGMVKGSLSGARRRWGWRIGVATSKPL